MYSPEQHCPSLPRGLEHGYPTDGDLVSGRDRRLGEHGYLVAGVDYEFGVAPARVGHEGKDGEETSGAAAAAVAAAADALVAHRGRAKQVEAPGEI